MSYPASTLAHDMRASRRYTNEEFAEIAGSSRNIRQMLRHLGLVPSGGNYESVASRADRLGIDISHLRRPTPSRCTDDELTAAVQASDSFAQVLRILGVKPGGNQARLRARIETLGLDTSHFVGQGWRRGATKPTVPQRPLQVLLVEDRLVKSNTLKARLISEGMKARRCETCLLEEWNGRPIPLELDHINGLRTDNRLANLRILCPNCHAQTDTYRGRNIGSSGRLS
jgi:hypothetical protein